ncbi:MAG: GSCFA domain-containing protein [Prevotellaceae bacterium]|jgi:hypothetical protein|nr:GSCFA domain-containing protein [Prevotellaceae bacterium]
MFSTKVEPVTPTYQLSHSDNILTLGSCFSEHIGKKLYERGFNVDVNPFGVLYNPVSVRNALIDLLENRRFVETDLFFYHDLWNSFSHSSLFSDLSPEKTVETINRRMETACTLFRHVDRLLITFGTAWVYKSTATGQPVANCHKLPSQHFVRYRLRVEDIVAAYRDVIPLLERQRPEVKVLFTVSPIRHLKDGAHENNISKGVLLLAVDELQKRFGNVDYFPAYEIMSDELRDYRYYADDMLHLSATAIDYIWEKFGDTYFSKTTKTIVSEIMSLKNDLNHKVRHPETNAHRIFLSQVENKKRRLLEKYPFLNDRPVVWSPSDF